MKRVLLTGASGFIGRNIISKLELGGYEVVPIVSISSRLITECTPYVCNLLNFNEVADLCKSVKATHLLHLAWHSDYKTIYESDSNLQWIGASLHLVREFLKNGGERVVIAGSCAEYNWHNSNFSEDDLDSQALTQYGRSKNRLRRLLEELKEEHSYSLGWARIFFVYGFYEPPHKFIASAIDKLLNGTPFFLQNGQLIRDYLHVTDVADALFLLLNSNLEGVVNVGSEYGHSLELILRIIESELKIIKSSVFIENKESLQPQSIVAKGSRLKTELGWQHSLSIQAGLSGTISWRKIHLREF
ncbi:MAG: NAD(P)-dependent oxidoreductase [Chlamydiae bacterium]|nr:NAD(P)-dependent oxidoreductase [Chlamydiota bacterium]